MDFDFVPRCQALFAGQRKMMQARTIVAVGVGQESAGLCIEKPVARKGL